MLGQLTVFEGTIGAAPWKSATQACLGVVRAKLMLNRPGFPRDSFPWFHATSSVTSLAA